MQKEFWKHKTLAQLSQPEWEALCDGCARCCLEKLEDAYTKRILYTRVACKILDIKKCRCLHYPERQKFVSDCLPITVRNNKIFTWLPATCAYRLLYEGNELPHWHYLVCGSRKAVHTEGISVRELALHHEDEMLLEDYIIDLI